MDVAAANKIMDKLKITLMMDRKSCFYTVILFSLKQVWESNITTAAVDGKNLLINMVWFMSLTAPQRIGLILHEVMHVALNHMTRRGNRDPNVFNQAGDHVINLLLKEIDYELPPGGLWDKRFKGMSTEQVYDILIKEPKTSPMSDPDVIYGTTADDIKDLEIHIGNILTRAKIQAEQAAGAGDIPGEILITLDKIMNPKLPWNVILQNYMSEYAQDDYSMRRCNRKYMPDFYLPTIYSESICNITAAFDLSGSMDARICSAYLAELDGIHKSLQPETLTILCFDTNISSINTITRDMDVRKDVKLVGGGGTDVTEVLKYIDKHKPDISLIFTDGDFNMPRITIKTDVIWLINGRVKFNPKFGKVIHYDL